jgi:hypothetical protein
MEVLNPSQNEKERERLIIKSQATIKMWLARRKYRAMLIVKKNRNDAILEVVATERSYVASLRNMMEVIVTKCR